MCGSLCPPDSVLRRRQGNRGASNDRGGLFLWREERTAAKRWERGEAENRDCDTVWQRGGVAAARAVHVHTHRRNFPLAHKTETETRKELIKCS